MSKSAATRKPRPPAKGADIPFYRSNEKPYGVFSNLFRRTMVFEGREHATAEHAYQAGKARKEAVREWILSAPSPSLVAMAAHGLYTWDIVPEWSRTKFDRMRDVLRAKFSQHEDLKSLLLSTGESRLIEAGRTDNLVNRTWGEVNGKGLNMLGVLLMEVRQEIREQAELSAKTSAKKVSAKKTGAKTTSTKKTSTKKTSTKKTSTKKAKHVNVTRARDAVRAVA